MPLYEYYCPENNRIYTFFTQRLGQHDRVPRCPDDAAYRMVRMMSGFSIGSGSRKADDDAGGPGDDLDDPRLEAAMGEMEREMAGMDEDNPDPRQMGRFMRRMSDLTGEPIDAGTEEMIRRLEAGEDPEKLEEELGDAFGDGSDEGDGPDAPPDPMSATRAAHRALRRRPVRDPELYTLEEYL